MLDKQTKPTITTWLQISGLAEIVAKLAGNLFQAGLGRLFVDLLFAAQIFAL